MGEPPNLGEVRYPAYRPWLDYTFFESICAYCGLLDMGVEIDHFEPKKYAPGRIDDPTNLTLGCARCNGRGGKSDYHPLHHRRTRLPHDQSGFMIVDVRVEDPATLFELQDDGTLTARPGASAAVQDRANRNIALLKLNRYARCVRRRELLALRDACELLVAQQAQGDVGVAAILRRLLPDLARRLMFFEMYDIPISPRLMGALRVLRKVRRKEECVYAPDDGAGS